MPAMAIARRLSRRSVLSALGAWAAAGVACRVQTQTAGGRDARITARLRASVTTTLRSGPLGLGSDRDGVIQMPGSGADAAVPLLVFLHGATQSGSGLLRRVGPAADAAGIALVLPDSRRRTWDAIGGRFGEDVVFLSRVFEHVFERLAVDPARVAIGGFSDGASYAISLGLANGDLFPRVVACSPGFVVPVDPVGEPRFFVSHGVDDQVLPIDRCSRVIVPRLRSLEYDVTYREFDGRHELPPAIATEALTWMALKV